MRARPAAPGLTIHGRALRSTHCRWECPYARRRASGYSRRRRSWRPAGTPARWPWNHHEPPSGQRQLRFPGDAFQPCTLASGPFRCHVVVAPHEQRGPAGPERLGDGAPADVAGVHRVIAVGGHLGDARIEVPVGVGQDRDPDHDAVHPRKPRPGGDPSRGDSDRAVRHAGAPPAAPPRAESAGNAPRPGGDASRHESPGTTLRHSGPPLPWLPRDPEPRPPPGRGAGPGAGGGAHRDASGAGVRRSEALAQLPADHLADVALRQLVGEHHARGRL